MNAKVKAIIFVGVFSVIGGMVILRNLDPKLLPSILFYVVLIINSYFSIEFFSKITPVKRPDQIIIDLLLVFSYLMLILNLSNEVWYLLFAIILFVVATLKYIFLLGAVDLKVLKKKMIIDSLGIMLGILALAGYMIGWEIIMWVWSLVFLLANIYLLIIKPMYRIDD